MGRLDRWRTRGASNGMRTCRLDGRADGRLQRRRCGGRFICNFTILNTRK